ncbi:Acetoacetyl-CoA synthetase [Lachnellula subtilissima]|uniref:Acetoacetyl-CoA synthetase n=1 Tax=Lachnellula subtilissima TaxID=602034 RepID=A0A8H8RY76_9HELO|nr:Acetoacetyl-CoA synthetase [Lachnellula subtilissima]
MDALWKHPAPEETQMYRFMQDINARKNLNLKVPRRLYTDTLPKTFQDLHEYSTANISAFWRHAFQNTNLVHDGVYSQVVDESVPMHSVPPWFSGIHLNFAENILYSGPDPILGGMRSTKGKEDEKIAIIEASEMQTDTLHVSWGQLRAEVMQIALAMKRQGISRGDRIAVVSGNSFNTLKVFLGIAALGGIFSSTSPDMGVTGILDRLVQLKPKLVFFDDMARYNGKTMDLRGKIKDVVAGLSATEEFQGGVIMPRFSTQSLDIKHIPRSQQLAAFLGASLSPNAVSDFKFERVAFKDPFLVVYSSGTSGMPKCIVHSVGGVLLSSAVHNNLHLDQTSKDIVLQFTTTGWIMYLLNVVHLIHGACLVLYDGSPFHPDLTSYLKLMSAYKVTLLGTSPKWLGEMQKHGIKPREVVDLSSLRVMISTGAVLPEPLFRWIYSHGFPSSIHVANTSGGTDIAGAFACGNPLTPVYPIGMQCAPLGIALAVYEDAEGTNLTGHSASAGTAGELVVTKAFPNMPCSFWGTDAKEKYFSSYFAKFQNVWTQGDNIAIFPGTQRVNFIGRSDGVLNPSGIRFGTSELYSIVEAHFPQVADSLAVGQKRSYDLDEHVVLFVMMKPGEAFTPRLCTDIEKAISKALGPRYVPSYIFQTPEIPTTSNFKKVELPVKKILCGETVIPSSTLANPDSLKYFYQFVDINIVQYRTSRL